MVDETSLVRGRNAAGAARRGWARLAGLAACASLAACAAPQILPPGPGPTQARIEPDLRAFVARDGYRLRWSVWPADKPWGVVLALHGMNDYGETYRPAAEDWSKKGLTVYAYDQRGFGRTLGDGVWPGTDALVSDVRDAVTLLAQRHPGTPIFLVGESMGGAVALTALGRDPQLPIAAAALLAPGLQGWSRLSLMERIGLWTLAHVTPSEPLGGRGLKLKPSDNLARLRAMAADPFVLKRVRADALFGLVRLMDDANAAAPQTKTPVLVVFGGQDDIAPIAPAQELQDKLGPRLTFKVYPQEDHLLLHGSARDRIFDDVRAYFATAIAKASPP